MHRKKKKLYVLRGRNDAVIVDELTYNTFYQMRRRAKYLDEADEKHGLVSYHSLDTDEYSGEEIIADDNTDSVENIVENVFMKDDLQQCLSKLTEDEQQLINERFYKSKTEKEIAVLFGVTQQAISKRIGKVVKKLRDIMVI